MRASHRKATMANMVKALIKHQRIETILGRAKVVRKLAEHVIHLTKTDTVDSRRQAYMVLGDRDLVAKLFNEIAPLCKNRTSGYTRIIPLGFRRGDGASMCVLELTDKKLIDKISKKKTKKSEEPAKAHAGAPEEKSEKAKEETPKAKPISKAKLTLAEEKMVEKAKVEEKKVADKRGFMKNIRGLFRKRGDR